MSDMPLAEIRKVSAAASVWSAVLNAAESDPTSAGIRARPAIAAISSTGAKLASDTTNTDAQARKMYTMPEVIAAQ